MGSPIIKGNATLYMGDCLDLLPTLPMVDAVVTDPPYGLKFMGKDWDHGVLGAGYWRIIMASMKPGAHLLAFGGTRTHHRLMCAIEDAGFEIRDCLMWVYGSGFPKSLDVSKAIDKTKGAERKIVGTTKGKGGENLNQISRPDGNDNKDAKGMGAYGHGAKQVTVDIPVTEPATPEAQQWDGWGTALKPAWEPIILARKPLDGSVAKNILEHGVGGLNIDGSRIPLNDEIPPSGSAKRVYAKNQFTEAKVYGENKITPPSGRFPANLIHDGSDEVLERFPKSSVTGRRSERSKAAKVGDTRWLHDNHQSTEHTDRGSTARFFYCAKASKAERGKDNNHPTVKPIALMRYLCRLITPPGGTIMDPFMGSGSTGVASFLENFAFIGMEKELPSFKIACNRIGQIQQQCDYFDK